MTRYFCGMWEYKTQVMNYVHAESFLAHLILKKHTLYICICDKVGNVTVAIRKDASNVYNFNNRLCVAGIVFYDTHYKIKIDSLNNVYLIPFTNKF